MHKIDTTTATAANEFTDGDSGSAQVATDLNASWFNTVQRELCNLVTGSGDVLSASDDSQILQAVRKLGFAGYYTENGALSIGYKAGSTIVFCSDSSDLIITGNIASGSVLFVVPIWASSATSVKVTYRSQSFTIYKNCMMIAFICFGMLEDFQFWGYNVPINSQQKMILDKAKFTELQATTATVGDVIYSTPFVTVTDDNADTWDNAENWSVGQAKHINVNSSRSINFHYTDALSMGFTLNKGYFVTLICTGTTTVDDTEKALLSRNL